ncbi:MAG: hypothetical protein OHK0013_34690 [Sandaracinaceae bacterium]
MHRLVVLLALAACGCGVGGHRILDDGCELTDERNIADLIGPAPDDVVLVGEPTPSHLAWSERAGLFVRALDEGAPMERLGAACDGGLATSGGLLACARRGDDAKADEGHVAIYDPRDGTVRARAAGVGPDGAGVGLAVDGDRIAIVWSRARGASSAVYLQEPGRDPMRISRDGVRAGRPSVLWERSRPGAAPALVAAWPETWTSPEGRVVGAVVAFEDGRPRELEPIAYDRAHPSLRHGPEGEALLVFRDRRPAGSRPRLFVRRLGRRDVARDGVHANADGEALAVPCAGAVVLVAPRTHSRAERIVAIRRHDAATLEGAGPEHQVYEHGAAFEHADARCVGHDLLIAVASRATIERPNGEVGTVRFRCPDPSATP